MLRAVLAITSAVVANNCIAQLNLSAVSCTLKLLSTDNGDVRFFLPFMSCLSITYSPSLFPVGTSATFGTQMCPYLLFQTFSFLYKNIFLAVCLHQFNNVRVRSGCLQSSPKCPNHCLIIRLISCKLAPFKTGCSSYLYIYHFILGGLC